MAPILSLPKDSLDHIKESVSLGVVSIWQVCGSSKSEKYFRSGFVFDCWEDKCMVLTLSKDWKEEGTVMVQFENGECFEALTTFGDKISKLVAIVLNGLTFEPKKITLSAHNVDQCEEVFHMGNFDERNANLNFSTGSVGLVGHENSNTTMFVHCCSQRLHLIGAPVFNLRSELVGINFSQKKKKNFFFSLDLEQIKRELNKLFGENLEHMAILINDVNTLTAERKMQ